MTKTIVSLQVPIEETIRVDTQTEIPRSIPLPPPIIPETEDSTSSPVSDTSSGYMSTSLSAVTLSEVYTLSWDLPPSSGSRAENIEKVLDEDEEEEENGVMQTFSPFSAAVQSNTGHESPLLDQSGLQESLLDLKEKADAESMNQQPSKSDVTLVQQEANQVLTDQLKEVEKPDRVAKAKLPNKTEQKQDSTVAHTGSEQLDHSETQEDSAVAQENETKQTELLHVDQSNAKTPSKDDLEVATTTKVECELSFSNEMQTSAQEGEKLFESTIPQPQEPTQDQTASESTRGLSPILNPALSEASAPDPEPPVDLGAQAPSKEQSTSDLPETNGGCFLFSPSATSEVQQPASSDKPDIGTIPSSKSGSSVANPFKIQKVKSSDLKSFLQIVGEEEDKPAQVDQASNFGAELSVPMESLEIISDSEEGDTAASSVLPDWLKEGEFVTVGANKSGTVRYVGPTDFAEGTWVGVELEVPAGRFKLDLALFINLI